MRVASDIPRRYSVTANSIIFLFFIISIVFHVLHPDHNLFSFLPSKSSPFFLYLHPLLLHSPAEKGRLPRMSTKYGILSCNKTRHLSLYQGWIKQPSRRINGLKDSKRVRDIPASMVRHLTRSLSYTTITYMRRSGPYRLYGYWFRLWEVL